VDVPEQLTRLQLPIRLLFLNVTELAYVNLERGHQAGDLILETVTARAQDETRADVVLRWRSVFVLAWQSSPGPEAEAEAVLRRHFRLLNVPLSDTLRPRLRAAGGLVRTGAGLASWFATARLIGEAPRTTPVEEWQERVPAIPNQIEIVHDRA
jgi:hypothetical protein